MKKFIQITIDLDRSKAFYHIYRENCRTPHDQRKYQKQTIGRALSSGMCRIQLPPALSFQSQAYAIRPPAVLFIPIFSMVRRDHTIDRHNAAAKHKRQTTTSAIKICFSKKH